MQRGKLEAIWIKRFRRGPMDAVDAADLVEGKGLVGNANQGGRRQVTIIERGAWEAALAEAGGSVPPSSRRANFMVSGVRLERTRGQILEIGACRVEILGETKPCERMEEALPGLRSALYSAWRGGVFGTVLTGGTVRVGDDVVVRGANAELWLDATEV